MSAVLLEHEYEAAQELAEIPMVGGSTEWLRFQLAQGMDVGPRGNGRWYCEVLAWYRDFEAEDAEFLAKGWHTPESQLAHYEEEYAISVRLACDGHHGEAAIGDTGYCADCAEVYGGR